MKTTQPIVAPFSGLDTLATNDWWNRGPNKIINLKVAREDVSFWYLHCAQQYLKLTAQLFPLYPTETREVRLKLKRRPLAGNSKQNINDIAATTFKVETGTQKKTYRIGYYTLIVPV